MNLYVLKGGGIWRLLLYRGVQQELCTLEDVEDLAGFLLTGFKERCREAKLGV